jgi:hypothetical protein
MVSEHPIYEGSTISTVAVAIIPLILWFAKHGTVFARLEGEGLLVTRWYSLAC